MTTIMTTMVMTTIMTTMVMTTIMTTMVMTTIMTTMVMTTIMTTMVMTTIMTTHDEAESGHEGHDHGAHDPHAWLSPKNAMNWLNVIAGRLSAVDPDNAGAYFANAAAGRTEIETLIGEVTATLDPVRGGQFIVFHDAYQYFEMDFDFPASGAISVSDASDPSPARIAKIQARIAEQGIDCVLAEPQFNPGLVATVLDGTDAQTGILDPLGSDLEPGPAFYPQLIRNLSTALAGCL